MRFLTSGLDQVTPAQRSQAFYIRSSLMWALAFWMVSNLAESVPEGNAALGPSHALSLNTRHVSGAEGGLPRAPEVQTGQCCGIWGKPWAFLQHAMSMGKTSPHHYWPVMVVSEGRNLVKRPEVDSWSGERETGQRLGFN